jgi:hypothetical protein
MEREKWEGKPARLNLTISDGKGGELGLEKR